MLLQRTPFTVSNVYGHTVFDEIRDYSPKLIQHRAAEAREGGREAHWPQTNFLKWSFSTVSVERHFHIIGYRILPCISLPFNTKNSRLKIAFDLYTDQNVKFFKHPL